MTREEAIKMIKAKLECMTRDVSGRDSDCINRRCDECPLNYEKGNMGEQKEWLRMAIEALKQQPHEDCISRKAVLEGLKSIAKAKSKSDAQKSLMGRVMFFAEHLPSVTPQPEKHTEERTETHACDCISRKAVLDSLHSCFTEGFNEDRWWNSTHVLDAINEVPSIQPQPKEEPQQKIGHWIKHKHNGKPYFKCSECLYFAPIEYSYCPRCGCRMQEVKK